MAKNKTVYICTECGAQSLQWKGQCGQCSAWNSLVESTARVQGQGTRRSISQARSPVSLVDYATSQAPFYGSGLESLDHLLGGGLVPGGVYLMAGEPGIGKSTLFLQIAGYVARDGGQVLYLSGEEGLSQLKQRAERLGMTSDRLMAVSTNQVEDGLEAMDSGRLSLLVADSVQTLGSTLAEGLPGSVQQVRAVSTQLIERAKQTDTTVILVGHVTKEGQIAGPKLLEHMVDTVLSLEGDRKQQYRLLRVLKNRFGPNQELAVFSMDRQGLLPVDDPSTLFLGDRDASLSGAAVVMTVDGQRPFAVEMQALVSRSFLSIPRRTALGFDVNRLHLILAVLEKRLRLNMGESDIYAKIGGGLRMQDPGLDLGLVAALLSSMYDIPLPERAVFWGEVDLNGHIRPVHGSELRLTQAQRLGYGPIISPDKESPTSIGTLADLQRMLFGREG